MFWKGCGLQTGRPQCSPEWADPVRKRDNLTPLLVEQPYDEIGSPSCCISNLVRPSGMMNFGDACCPLPLKPEEQMSAVRPGLSWAAALRHMRLAAPGQQFLRRGMARETLLVPSLARDELRHAGAGMGMRLGLV
jgi:hypothetical protein